MSTGWGAWQHPAVPLPTQPRAWPAAADAPSGGAGHAGARCPTFHSRGPRARTRGCARQCGGSPPQQHCTVPMTLYNTSSSDSFSKRANSSKRNRLRDTALDGPDPQVSAYLYYFRGNCVSTAGVMARVSAADAGGPPDAQSRQPPHARLPMPQRISGSPSPVKVATQTGRGPWPLTPPYL